ncbi:MAG: hypothetical protein QME61_00740 [Patescibacteria group bacterium]|nr:hypothetical protein [Patescibacteria group bacterium]
MTYNKIFKAIDKLEKYPNYFCKSRKLRQRLVKIAKTTKPIKILKRPVWIIRHSLIKDKLAIRPFGLIFISKKIPKELREVVVKHEIIEEKYEFLSKRKAHTEAIKEELQYAKKRKKLEKLLNFLKRKYPKIYSERVRELFCSAQIRYNR